MGEASSNNRNVDRATRELPLLELRDGGVLLDDPAHDPHEADPDFGGPAAILWRPPNIERAETLSFIKRAK